MQYCLTIRNGATEITYGPADYDDAIKFGMALLESGFSVRMKALTPIPMEEN